MDASIVCSTLRLEGALLLVLLRFAGAAGTAGADATAFVAGLAGCVEADALDDDDVTSGVAVAPPPAGWSYCMIEGL